MTSDELATALLDNETALRQHQARRIELLREADARNLGVAAGAANTQQWVAGLLRMSAAEAGGLVKLARHLDAELPATTAALQAGKISLDHARVISKTVHSCPPASPPRTCGPVWRPPLPVRRRRSMPRLSTRSAIAFWRPSIPTWLTGSWRRSCSWKRRGLTGIGSSGCRGMRLLAPTGSSRGSRRWSGRSSSWRWTRWLLRSPGLTGAMLVPPSSALPMLLVRQFIGCWLSGWFLLMVGTRPSSLSPSLAPEGGPSGTGVELSRKQVELLMCEADKAFLFKPEHQPGRVSLLTDKQERLFQKKLRRLLELRDGGCASRDVTGHRTGATPTTSSPGAKADPPPATTGSCSAATTTG